MLEEILRRSEAGYFILDNSRITTQFTRRSDPLCADAIRSLERMTHSDNGLVSFGAYAGGFGLAICYGAAELGSRITEMIAKGILHTLNKGYQAFANTTPRRRTGVVAAAALIVVAYVSFMRPIPQPHLPQNINNPNAYCITVNSGNTSTLENMGWLGRYPRDYVILSGEESKQEMRAELSGANPEPSNQEHGRYGVLILTGHHAGGNGLYGNTTSLDFSELPESGKIEAVIFSACTTAGTDENTVKGVYAPLIGKFPNLKVIVGYEEGSPENDWLIRRVASRQARAILTQSEGISTYTNSVIGMSNNDFTLGVLRQNFERKWYYTSPTTNGSVDVKIPKL